MKRLIIHHYIALFAVIFMTVISLFILNVARADSWSWTNSVPTTVNSDEIRDSDDLGNNCVVKFGTMRDNRKIEGVKDQSRQYTTACVIATGDNYKLFEGDDGKLAVSFAGESNAHLISSGATCFYGCVYMPSRDYLINIQSPGTFGDGKVVIFKNFVKRLQMQRIILPILRTESYFTGALNPDEILTDRFKAEDFNTSTKHLQRSQNDKWLILELVGRGMYRMDMDTGQTTKFLYWATRYWGPSSAPSMQIDVTNDGRFVAIFGRNTSNAIYELAPGCGFTVPSDPAQLNTLERPGQLASECQALYLAAPMNDPANNTYMPNLAAAYQPKFSDDGGEITFYAAPYTGLIRHIRLHAANYIPSKQLDYLALGDSYSSGEGDTENNAQGNRYYRQFTNTLGSSTQPKERCHVSTRSYPYILAQGMNLSLNSQWNTVACSGATAWDVKAQGTLAYTGQSDRLKNFDYNALKAQALNEFIPGRQKQIEFVRKYRPKVITLTMGGNDIGFSDKVKSCVVSIESCKYVGEQRNVLAKEVRDQYDNLLSLYRELFKASGSRAKIYVLGYPNFVNGDPAANCDLNIGVLNAEERELFKNGVTYLNNVIQQAAAAAGIKYIDIENSLNGHMLCDSGNKYVTGLTDFTNFSNNRQESFHPNANGNFKIALSVWNTLGHADLENFTICPNGDINCPDTGATKDSIVTPQYFIGLDTKLPIQHKEMTFFDYTQESIISFVLPSFTFAKNSNVSVVLHSDPVNIGTFTANETGGVSVTSTIPSSVPVGYHTLLVSGTSFTGEPIEYEQTILVLGANQNDIDNDSVVDSSDKCLLIKPSGLDTDEDRIDDACDPETSPSSNIKKNNTRPTVHIVSHATTQKSNTSNINLSIHILFRTLITIVINSYIQWLLFIFKIVFLLMYSWF